MTGWRRWPIPDGVTSLPSALARALGQLADPAILRVLVKSVIVTLVVFALLGAAGFTLLRGVLDGWTGGFGEEAAALAAVLAVVIGGWLLFRIVALAVIQFFAEEVVRAVETRYYPQAASMARSIPLRESLWDGAKSALVALAVNLAVLPLAAVLLVTGVGTVALFGLVNAWLIGRELQALAWARHRRDRREAPPIGGGTRFLLGGAIAGLLAIPFVNLVAPVIGAATATHLVHSRRGKENPSA